MVSKVIWGIGLVFSIFIAYLCLTANVGLSAAEGATVIVQPGTSAEAIEQTTSLLRFVGIFWAFIAVVCLISLLRRKSKNPPEIVWRE